MTERMYGDPAVSPGVGMHVRAGTLRRWERWLAPAFVVVAAGASLLLAAMLFLVQRAIGDASVQLVRGEAVQLAGAVHEALRHGPRPPQAATLEEVLARARPQGLRYVAMLRPEGSAIEVQAGTPASPLTPDVIAGLGGMEPVMLDGRVRFATGPPRDGAGPDGRGREPGRWDSAPDPWGEEGAAERPLPPPPPGRGSPPRLIIEFEPLAARQLTLLAQRTLLAGLVALPAFVCCAGLLGYLVRQRNRLVRRLEQDRRFAALGEMSAVLAHEIRNPLASLKGHAQLLARSLDGDAPRAAKAELIVREAIRLQDLATDLLDFAGSGTVELCDADPAALLRESAEAVDAARIALAVDAAPRSWRLDPRRTRQALVNVLRNAVQASPDGAAVRAAAFVEQDRLVFEVRDHGAGITPGDEEEIFEPFHTRKLRGTGLGLPIARRVLALQGGSIVASNAADGGAVFRIAIART